MCDCGEFDCRLCTNQTNNWVKWAQDVESIRKHWPTGTLRNGLRLGQYLYNHLYRVKPLVACQICGSIVDPFHNDDKITAFLEKVDELWTV